MADEEKIDVQKELDDMIKSLGENISEESEVEEPEVSKVDEPKEPESKTEVETKTETKEEEPKVEPESKVEEPKVEEPKVEVPDERDKTIADLRAKLAEKETSKEPEKKPVPEPSLELAEQDFLESMDLDDLSRDPKKFNALLNKIYKTAVTDTRKVLGEGILRSIPDIVRTNLTMMNDLQKMSDKFYSENEDLKPFKKVVAAVFEEIAAENPGKKYDEVVKQVAPEVRKRLELHQKAVTTETKKNIPPKLPHKGGTAGKSSDKPSVEPLQVELEEMNKVIGR